MASVAHPICPPTFDSLPNEIISAVCSHLPFESCRQVVPVSRRLKAICEPHLYHDIQFKIRNGERQKDKLRLDGLVDNLEKRPELCFYVKTLTLDTRWDYDRRDELQRLLPEVRHLNTDTLTADGYLDVRHMHNLETLRMDHSWFTEVHFVDIMADHLWMPCLRQVEVVEPRFSGHKGIVFEGTLDDPGPHCFVKTLQDARHMNEPPRTSPVTTLRWTDCDHLPFTVLSSLLQSLRVLKCLTFTYVCPWEQDNASRVEMSPADFSRALEPHMGTVVELIIASQDAAQFHLPSFFGTLANYRHLKRLAIPEPFLISNNSTSTIHPLLPSQLEYIQLQYPMMRVYRADTQRDIRHTRMHNLAAAKPHSLPNLKRVIWWYQHREHIQGNNGHATRYGGLDSVTEMVQRFSEVGVHFESMSGAFHDETPFGGSNKERLNEEAENWRYGRR